ncbi:UDP-N-acetylmuramyl-tripeptide synthetase [Alkaliphilus sp. MSJ-5]|uniref:UDP-N-acetylmuramyl-tripeptide synthetase n=1 Tax=Alkaliphilus flagellatus TaxID=2841507 RepID=A0ABS6G6M4_9FIRM|nr:UDP-N-acetylmuramyl-tripeptide synthetase [Alkaliphilus flagellatus]MBU5677041.1 UDP-N-acetylmuramyl-tripeptide synthetase [Alkaliphilus flagellatus]
MMIDGIKIKGITSDSRQVRKDYVFVALTGENKDGNKFIDEAVESGAVIVYTEKDIYRKDCIVKKVNNGRKKLAELCNEFYGYPSEKLLVIGVTGTNGKTTTTNLIYHILKEAGIAVGIIGTLHIKIGKKQYPSKLTTPITEDIYYYLNRMVEENIRVAVLEVSSHGLKTDRVYGVKFDIAIHTNINQDHLNFHKTITDYIKSKKKLFDSLAAGKIALINHDDNYGLKMLEGNNEILIISYGLSSKSTVTASSIDTDFLTSFNYCLQRGITTLSGVEIEVFEYPINSNLLGNHNIYNALSAISTCLLLDVPIEKIAKAIKSYPPVTRRMEIIYKDKYTVIDDYCHNPASYEAVFHTIQTLQYNNLYIVNGIRGNRGLDINRRNAEVLKQWYEILNVRKLIITDSVDCVDNLNRVSNEERQAYFEVLKDSLFLFKYEASLRNAIKEILKELKPNDILLLLGAQSMDKGKSIFLDLINEKESINIIQQQSKIYDNIFDNH